MRAACVFGRVVLGALLASGASGCGRATGRSAGEPESVEQFAIAQVGQIFRVYQKGKKPPPKGLADLAALQTGYPAAIASIRSKEVLLFWGAGLADGPEAASTVLAYQKDVPEKGGEVLMQDGTAKKMTAEEFLAARKPEGAKTDPGPSAKKAR